MYHAALFTCAAFCLSHLDGIIQRAIENSFLLFARGGGGREKFVVKVGRGNVYRNMVLKIYLDGFRNFVKSDIYIYIYLFGGVIIINEEPRRRRKKGDYCL